jgi:hypothetical protein
LKSSASIYAFKENGKHKGSEHGEALYPGASEEPGPDSYEDGFPGFVRVFCHHFCLPPIATFAFREKLLLIVLPPQPASSYNQVIERLKIRFEV